MNTWEKATTTKKAIALNTKLHSGTTLSLTRAVAGAGTVDVDTLPDQTSVTDERQELVFSAHSYPEEGLCAVPLKLYNNDVETGYKVTQIGVYAFDPDEGEILYLIAQAKANKGTDVPSKTEMPGYASTWTFYVEYGMADGVTITVDPAGSVTPDDVNGIVRQYIEDNLGNVDNTSDATKNVAFASEAAVARKAEHEIIIRFNGGQTEGTDKWTYDGSTSRSINITPDKIGAAPDFFLNQVSLSDGALDFSTYETAGLYLFTSSRNITIGGNELGTKTLLAYIYGYEADHEKAGTVITTYHYYNYLRDVATGVRYKVHKSKGPSAQSYSYSYTVSQPAYET